MRHLHHKVPRHMGGTDDPENLESLTLEEHAEAHRILYEKFGCWEDRIAYLGLSGALSKEEVLQEVFSNAGKEGNGALTDWYSFIKGKSYEEIFGPEKAADLKLKRSEAFRGQANPMFGTQHTEEWRDNHSRSLQGERHFNYGKPAFTRGRIWINNSVKSRMINPEDFHTYQKQGWIKGRIFKAS